MAPPKSHVWKNFQKINATEAKCKLCFKILKTCGNTTNLNKHMKKKHSAHESSR